MSTNRECREIRPGAPGCGPAKSQAVRRGASQKNSEVAKDFAARQAIYVSPPAYPKTTSSPRKVTT
jgi:hypothetical protein